MSGWVEGNQSARIRLLFAFSAQLKKNYRPPVTFRMFSSFYSHKSPLRIAGALTLSPNPAPASFFSVPAAARPSRPPCRRCPKGCLPRSPAGAPSRVRSSCAGGSVPILRRWTYCGGAERTWTDAGLEGAPRPASILRLLLPEENCLGPEDGRSTAAQPCFLRTRTPALPGTRSHRASAHRARPHRHPRTLHTRGPSRGTPLNGPRRPCE